MLCLSSSTVIYFPKSPSAIVDLFASALSAIYDAAPCTTGTAVETFMDAFPDEVFKFFLSRISLAKTFQFLQLVSKQTRSRFLDNKILCQQLLSEYILQQKPRYTFEKQLKRVKGGEDPQTHLLLFHHRQEWDVYDRIDGELGNFLIMDGGRLWFGHSAFPAEIDVTVEPHFRVLI